MKFPLDMYLGDRFNRATVKTEEEFKKFKELGYTYNGAKPVVKVVVKEIEAPKEEPKKEAAQKSKISDTPSVGKQDKPATK